MARDADMIIEREFGKVKKGNCHSLTLSPLLSSGDSPRNNTKTAYYFRIN